LVFQFPFNIYCFVFLGLSYIFFSFFVKTTFYTLTSIRFPNCLLTFVTVQTPTEKSVLQTYTYFGQISRNVQTEVLLYVLLSSLIYTDPATPAISVKYIQGGNDLRFFFKVLKANQYIKTVKKTVRKLFYCFLGIEVFSENSLFLFSNYQTLTILIFLL